MVGYRIRVARYGLKDARGTFQTSMYLQKGVDKRILIIYTYS